MYFIEKVRKDRIFLPSWRFFAPLRANASFNIKKNWINITYIENCVKTCILNEKSYIVFFKIYEGTIIYFIEKM